MVRASRRWGGRWRGAARHRPRTGTPDDEQTARLAGSVRDFERARARYERAIEALDERSAELELQPNAEQVVTDAMKDDAAENGTPTTSGEPLRLADAGFHDLRLLGLSVTQAKRVLSMRESGALASTADLASVPGLPERQVARLRRVLRD